MKQTLFMDGGCAELAGAVQFVRKICNGCGLRAMVFGGVS